jgi:competence protein ComEC
MRLIYIVLGWSAGILLAANNSVHQPFVWLILSLAALLLLWFDRRTWMVALLALMLGGLRFSLTPATSSVAAFNNDGGLTLEGRIVAEPDRRDDRTQLILAAESLTRAGATMPTDGLVLARVARTATVNYGDQVAVTGELIAPAEFDTFSYADFLARQGVFSIMPNAALEVIESGGGDPFTTTLLNAKDSARTRIAAMLPEPQAGLLAGILLGDERGIAPELADAFAATGAAHVIAISGFNMVVLAGAIKGLFSRMGLGRWRVAIFSLTIIMIYTLFVGANPAVLRAALMSGLLIVGEALNRRTYVPASLVFAALLLSLLNPTVLWDISFQLSLFATLSLSLFANPLSFRFNRLLRRLLPDSLARRTGSLLAEPLVASVAAQILVLPLIVLYFGRLSLVTLPVNLLIVPAQSVILIVGGLATLISFIMPEVGQAMYWLALVPLGWTIGVVRAFAALPFAEVAYTVDPRGVGAFFMIVFAVALGQATQPAWLVRVARFARSRSVLLTILFSGATLLILIGGLYVSRPDGQLHVHFLDVGHSNAVLLQTPGGAHILVDGGRFPSRLLTSIGDRLPFNDRAIEVLVLTQPDEFDIGALTAVLTRYDVGVVLWNGQPNQGEAFLELGAELAQHDMVRVEAGYTLEMSDGTLIEVLHPADQPALNDSFDDHAVALRVSYDEVSFLLTSDLSADAQQAIMDAGGWFTATVMQLPHHGAARSLDEDFLAMVQPSLIVAQIDPANRLGDPDSDTLTLLGDIPMLRTDEMGAAHLWTDGEELWAAGERQ